MPPNVHGIAQTVRWVKKNGTDRKLQLCCNGRYKRNRAQNHRHDRYDDRPYRLFLFPQIEAFRIIGRIAYPIFAYMIAEGCRYTRNKVKYLLSVLGVGCGCSAVSYITEGSLYQSILITFACSIALIFVLEKAISGSRHLEKVLFGLSGILLTGLYFCLFRIHIIPGLETDYGFYGILTPALIRFGRNKSEKLLALTVGLCLISIGGMPSQLFSLAAVGILAFYNGKRGKHGMKWLFYGYYPLHIAVLYAISQLVHG